MNYERTDSIGNISRETYVIKGMPKSKGKNISVTPEDTATGFLHYGRIMAGVTFSSDGN